MNQTALGIYIELPACANPAPNRCLAVPKRVTESLFQMRFFATTITRLVTPKPAARRTNTQGLSISTPNIKDQWYQLGIGGCEFPS